MHILNILESGNDNLISSLPLELIYQIASQLSYLDILHLCQTSSYLNQMLCQSDFIWELRVYRDISSTLRSSNYYNLYHKIRIQIQNLKPSKLLLYAAKNGYD